MDPGLIKLLEDDEDENALPVSGAAVEAFAAELNRDVIGGTAAAETPEANYGGSRVGNGTFQPTVQTPAIGNGPPEGPSAQGKPLEGNTGGAPQSSSVQWGQLNPQQQQEVLRQRRQRLIQQQQQQHQAGSGAGAGPSNPEKKPTGISYGISFSQLMPLLHPHLPPEQGQQLNTLFQRFKINEITREDFVRGCRSIAGDQMLVQTIRQMQLKQMQQTHQIRQQKYLQQGSSTSQTSSEQSQQSQQQQFQMGTDQEKVKQLSETESNSLQGTTSQQDNVPTDVESQQQDSKSQPPPQNPQQQQQGQTKAEPQTPQQSQLQNSQSGGQLQLDSQAEQQQVSGIQSGSQILETVKNEVDKQFKQQQQQPSTPTTGLPVASRLPLTAPAVPSGQQPTSQVMKVGPHPQALSQSQVQSPGGSAQSSEKPLSKYQKQKARKEQKRRDEEEQMLRNRKLQSGGNLAAVTPTTVQQQSQQLQQSPTQPQQTVSVPQQAPVSQQMASATQHQNTSVPKQQQVTPLSKSFTPSSLSVKQEPAEQQGDSSQTRQFPQSAGYSDVLAGQSGSRSVADGTGVNSGSQKDMFQKGAVAEQDHLSPSPGGFSSRAIVSSAPSGSMPCAISQETSYAAQVLLHSSFPPTKVASHSSTLLANRSGATAVATQNKPSSGAIIGLTTPAVGAPGQGQSVGITGTLTFANSLMGKTPIKKPIIGQKKAADTAPASMPLSKKQKVAGADVDQTIDQLNDVTAVSGVNLREEEEQLLAGPKEESRTTDAIRRFVQEEEEKLFLEKGPLRAKINEIAKTRGIRAVTDEVERCLSTAAEELFRSMIYDVIKLSKQRCDSEKDRHKIVVISDLRKQLLLLKKKEKEALEKKNAEESERLRKMHEKKEKGTLADVEKEELRAKAQKAQQEEEDKMRANAANLAARAAVGVDDMLSKWQMMAEQGRQKRQAGDTADGGGVTKEQERRIDLGQAGAAVGPGRPERDAGASAPSAVNNRPPGSGAGTGSTRARPTPQVGRHQRSVTLNDAIAWMERDQHLCKSTLLYRLYERRQPSSDVADRTSKK